MLLLMDLRYRLLFGLVLLYKLMKLVGYKFDVLVVEEAAVDFAEMEYFAVRQKRQLK